MDGAPNLPNLEALADRLREVRRQLSRGQPLANVMGREEQSAATLRAAQRLEAAVQRLSEDNPVKRFEQRHRGRGLHWLVRMIEARASALERSLGECREPRADDILPAKCPSATANRPSAMDH